jgi:PAS domain S-box-containing protein
LFMQAIKKNNQEANLNIIDLSSEPLILLKGSEVLDCNKAALELFGYEQKSHLLSQTVYALLVATQPDGVSSPQKLLHFMEQVQEEGLGKEVMLCRRQEGTLFIADLQVLCIKQENGAVLYQTKWNNTRKAPEKPLPTLPSFSGTEKEAGFGLMNIDGKGRIMAANNYVSQLLSYSISELNAQTIQNLQGQDKKEILPDWISSAGRTLEEEAYHSIRFFTKAQEVVEVQVRCIKINTEAQGVTYQLVLQHLSHAFPPQKESLEAVLEIESLKQENKNLKRVQKLLKKSVDRLKVLAECSPDVIMQFDRAHRHQFVNTQVEGQMGLSVEDFLGKTHGEMNLPPAFSKECDKALEAVFQSGQNGRTELQLPNGNWVDWILIPEFNARGEVNTIISTARDITEQKKTAHELQKAEQRLNDAFEVTQLSNWEYDLKTDQVQLNQNFQKLIGIENSEQHSLTGKEFIERFVVKEDLGKFKFLLKSALESCCKDFKEVLDYRLLKPSGEMVHVLASVRLEIGDDGRVSGAYGTSQDITYLRLTEQELEEYRTSLERLVETRTQELKKSEAKLADALRLANLGTWEYDPAVDSFLVSEEVLEIMGTTSEIENGLLLSLARCREIIYAEDYRCYREAVYRALESEDDDYTDQTTFRVVRSDGDVRHIYLSIKINRNDRAFRFFGTIQDITDIRRTETEKDRLNEIIETTSDIVGIAHVDGSITYLNKAGKDFFGVKEGDELHTKTFYSFQPQNSPKVITQKELKHADKHGTWSGQNYYMRNDGVEVPVSQVIISHKNSEGQADSYSTIIRDISQQKRIEQDLIFKNNELDTFVYRASHDLRGPIATLLGLYNLVQYEVEENNDKARALFDMYHSQVLRLNTITLTLIELTKIKDSEFKPAVINFNKLIQNVYSKLQGMVESKDMLFTGDVEPVAGFLSDERLLLVILQNLVENAIKYKRKEVASFVRVVFKIK